MARPTGFVRSRRLYARKTGSPDAYENSSASRRLDEASADARAKCMRNIVPIVATRHAAPCAWDGELSIPFAPFRIPESTRALLRPEPRPRGPAHPRRGQNPAHRESPPKPGRPRYESPTVMLGMTHGTDFKEYAFADSYESGQLHARAQFANLPMRPSGRPSPLGR